MASTGDESPGLLMTGFVLVSPTSAEARARAALPASLLRSEGGDHARNSSRMPEEHRNYWFCKLAEQTLPQNNQNGSRVPGEVGVALPSAALEQHSF